MKFDMHIHSEYSKDCDLKIKDIIQMALNKGLDGISITDHNIIRGSLEALKFVKKNKIKLKIIPGVEIKTNYGEIIAYNIFKEIKERDFFSVMKKLKKLKAIISFPHPLDILRKSRINKKILNKTLKNINFIEINSRTIPFFNKKTRKFAQKYNLRLIGGSDAHFLNEIGKIYTIMDDKFNVKRVVGNGSYFNLIELVKTKLKKLGF